jgi:hypothetical protein
MVLGVVLLVAGLAIRAGVFRPAAVVAGPVPSTPVAPVTAATTPIPTASPSPRATAEPQPESTQEPTPMPSPEPTPEPTDDLLFADEFDVEAAWPTGPVTGITARYAGGV